MWILKVQRLQGEMSQDREIHCVHLKSPKAFHSWDKNNSVFLKTVLYHPVQ